MLKNEWSFKWTTAFYDADLKALGDFNGDGKVDARENDAVNLRQRWRIDFGSAGTGIGCISHGNVWLLAFGAALYKYAGIVLSSTGG